MRTTAMLLAALAAALAVAGETRADDTKTAEPVAGAAEKPAKAEEDSEAAKAKRLDAILADLGKRLGAMKTLRARFEQKKHLDVFDDVVTSEGTLLLAAPDRLRWQYDRPLRTVLIVNGERARRERTTRKGITTGRTYDLEDEPVTGITARQVFLWTRGDFERARKDHDLELVSEKPLVLRATPRSSAVKEIVRAVDLRFAQDRSALEAVTLRETSGARTDIAFRDVEVDPRLAASLFQID
jgi:outer membrane lipoprotein-sorting protein